MTPDQIGLPDNYGNLPCLASTIITIPIIINMTAHTSIDTAIRLNRLTAYNLDPKSPPDN